MMNRVFVYGSMTEGMIHYNKIQSYVTSSQAASAPGAAYQLRVGYPILMRGDSERVPGQLVEVRSPDFFIPLLDQFYGFSSMDPSKSLHFRDLAPILLDGGETVESWVYFLNPKKLPPTAVKIDPQQWEVGLRSPKFVDQLTDRQIAYIKKLGAVTGRAVVPIDLPLYRELMGLELIIDKGRRLALSKFGQEVYRYLGDI